MNCIRVSNSWVHRLYWRPCCKRGSVPWNFNQPKFGAPTFILFLTAAHVKFKSMASHLGQNEMVWKGCPSTGYHTRVLIPQAGRKVKQRSMDTFSTSKNGAGGHLTFKWPGPTGSSPSCTKLWLSSSAWNQATIFLFRLLVPRSWFLLRTLVNVLGQMPSLILKQCFSTLASLWKHPRSFKNPSNKAVPPNRQIPASLEKGPKHHHS